MCLLKRYSESVGDLETPVAKVPGHARTRVRQGQLHGRPWPDLPADFSNNYWRYSFLYRQAQGNKFAGTTCLTACVSFLFLVQKSKKVKFIFFVFGPKSKKVRFWPLLRFLVQKYKKVVLGQKIVYKKKLFWEITNRIFFKKKSKTAEMRYTLFQCSVYCPNCPIGDSGLSRNWPHLVATLASMLMQRGPWVASFG